MFTPRRHISIAVPAVPLIIVPVRDLYFWVVLAPIILY